MKSIAQVLREFMDQVHESAPKYYDMTATVLMPEPAADASPEEWDNWEEEKEIGINYKLEGRYIPASFDNPAEYPNVESWQAYDLETGEELKINDPKFIDRVESKIYDHLDTIGTSYDDAGADRDDRDDY